MGKLATYGLIFVGGVAAGLFIAKQYAKHETEDTIHGLLETVGLGGGKIEAAVDAVVVPLVVD